jgi:hypothetical protein
LVNQITETIRSSLWIIAFCRYCTIWIHIVCSSVEKNDIWPLLQGWANMIRNVLDSLSRPGSLQRCHVR